jgi:hypothetical protein
MLGKIITVVDEEATAINKEALANEKVSWREPVLYFMFRQFKNT